MGGSWWTRCSSSAKTEASISVGSVLFWGFFRVVVAAFCNGAAPSVARCFAFPLRLVVRARTNCLDS